MNSLISASPNGMVVEVALPALVAASGNRAGLRFLEFFAAVNLGDSAVLSGGSWQPGLPLANLQQPTLAYVARSVDALATSTRIDIDLGNATTVVRLLGVMRHNLSTAATYRVTAGSTVGGVDGYDSGSLPVWPRIYDYMDLPYGAPNWWSGQISDAEAVNYPLKLLHDTGSNCPAR